MGLTAIYQCLKKSSFNFQLKILVQYTAYTIEGILPFFFFFLCTASNNNFNMGLNINVSRGKRFSSYINILYGIRRIKY